MTDQEAVIRDYLNWQRAIHGGVDTEGLHRRLVSEARPKPSLDDVDKAWAALVAERDAAGDDLKRLRDKFARRHKEALQAEARADAAEKERDDLNRIARKRRLRADALQEAAQAALDYFKASIGEPCSDDCTDIDCVPMRLLIAALADRGQG